MIVRRAVIPVALLGLMLAIAPAGLAGASGGGGCGEPITDEAGAEVDIKRFCFSPTVLYARPGDTVTFTNKDRVPHNVGGANLAWGSFEQLRWKRSVSYEFSNAGVYSYVCSIHPGMVGTVVVGNPGPDAADAGTEVVPVKAVAAVKTESSGLESTGSSAGAVVLGGLAIWFGGVLVGTWAGRRRAAAG
ncbi:MAG: plastocyanin/azurin family copper-binding protein [Actinomycetota bacterium]